MKMWRNFLAGFLALVSIGALAAGGSSSSLISSVFGRHGAIVAQSGDYSTSQITTNTSGSSPGAGVLGQQISGATVSASGAVIPVANSGVVTNAPFAPLSLTAGSWACSGTIATVADAGSPVVSQIQAGISTSSGALPAFPTTGAVSTLVYPNSNAFNIVPVGTAYLNLSASTNVYLAGAVFFTGASSSVYLYGTMTCTRIG
ncbi:MAG: hypothetical protein JO107_16110 [Hyphomicrobiales bacterium]|nr:hypothetical protein [Hyphomicrobiales bacterium]